MVIRRLYCHPPNNRNFTPEIATFFNTRILEMTRRNVLSELGLGKKVLRYHELQILVCNWHTYGSLGHGHIGDKSPIDICCEVVSMINWRLAVSRCWLFPVPRRQIFEHIVVYLLMLNANLCTLMILIAFRRREHQQFHWPAKWSRLQNFRLPW
jgi:hypothetical protein